jgi:hypothetical protein
MLAGHLINAATHYAIDRRRPLIRMLRTRLLDKGDYLDHATVQRRDGVVDTAVWGTGVFFAGCALVYLLAAACAVTTSVRNYELSAPTPSCARG